MPTNLSHFAINADDVYASKTFYEQVLGWRFSPWGPPGFFEIETGTEAEPGIGGALQQRRALIDGQPTLGLECTFAVDDVDATARAVIAAGGTLLMERFTIAGVGHLIFFADPSGNPIGAMQYDPGAA
ncbi:VOC family protein [Nocardia bovistercoris]|uniref:VOC family protein n=1 Tax=Nocardia bovistercoris TaxID=2785916 RepID=A0A931I9Z5_9NOCA|nr:VOC family protein [Nocardia bovistercoris]MBH0776043.1 VOC family protein [Nocardia bovistercoris]